MGPLDLLPLLQRLGREYERRSAESFALSPFLLPPGSGSFQSSLPSPSKPLLGAQVAPDTLLWAFRNLFAGLPASPSLTVAPPNRQGAIRGLRVPTSTPPMTSPMQVPPVRAK